MEITQAHKDLLNLLTTYGVSTETTESIMTAFKKSEEMMVEMILYIIKNLPSEEKRYLPYA